MDGLPFERPKGPITHGHFERVHEQANAKIAAIAQELKLTREQLEETSKKVGVPSEDFTKKLEELRRERDEYSEKLLRQAAQEHPEFQKKYVARQKEITERLNLRAKEMGVPEESIDMALRSSFRRRAEIVEDMDINPTAKAALINMMEQHDAIEGEKGGFLAQSREELTKWQRQQQEAAEAQDRERAAMEERTFAAVAEKMSKTFAPFQKVEGNAAWNAQADALHAEAKKYFNGQVPLESLAEVVHRGLGARVLEEKIIPGLRSQLQSLAAENARLKAAQPGAGGDKPGGARPVEDDSHLTAEQRAQATFRRFQAMGANNGFGQ